MELKSINKELSVVGGPLLISGPCSAETEEQLIYTCQQLADTNKVDILRAGIWKPRTKPGNFEGIGIEALKWLETAKKETGLKTATEIANIEHVDAALKHNVDILWLGARTTVNPFIVQEIAESLRGVNTIVLVKNPVNPDLGLWEGALERLYKADVKKLGAIHRGFHSYGNSKYRNDPLWKLPIELKQKFPELTMICDPSHICGERSMLLETSQKAIDLNFDGLMIESHCNPKKAWSDAQQQITPKEVFKLIKEIEIRKTKAVKDKEHSKLSELRLEINDLDSELINILSQRMQIVEKIGYYKEDNNIKILQSDRWENVLKRIINEGKKKGLKEQFIKKILTEIHINSIEKQDNIMNKKKWLKDYKLKR